MQAWLRRSTVSRPRVRLNRNSINSLRSKIAIRPKTVLFIISWLFSSAGCCYQIWKISEEYFEYGTNTLLTITRELAISPPSVNLCFNNMDMVNFSILFPNDGNDHVTAEDMFADTVNSSEVAELCKIHLHDSYLQKLDMECKHVEIKKFLKQSMICFSSRLVSTKPFEPTDISDGLIASLFELVFRGKHFGNSKSYRFYMTSQDKHLYGNGATYVEVDRLRSRSPGKFIGITLKLSYSTFKSKLLPAPYRSNCLMYSTIGYESRDHCRESCLINRTIDKFNKVPENVLISTESPLRHYNLLSYEQSEEYAVDLRLFRSECRRKCSNPDCSQEDILPKVISTEDFLAPEIILNASNEPEIITELKAKISFIEYVTYVLSCLSFWLGFCPLSLLMNTHLLRLCRSPGSKNAVEPLQSINQDHIQLQENSRNINTLMTERTLSNTRLNNLNVRVNNLARKQQ